MIPFLMDEDLNARILRGLARRSPDLNYLTVTAIGLAGQTDADVLAWAAMNGRVVITHDVNTLIEAAIARVRRGEPMPGVIAIPQQLGVGPVIEDVLLIATLAEPHELEGQIWYLPL